MVPNGKESIIQAMVGHSSPDLYPYQKRILLSLEKESTPSDRTGGPMKDLVGRRSLYAFVDVASNRFETPIVNEALGFMVGPAHVGMNLYALDMARIVAAGTAFDVEYPTPAHIVDRQPRSYGRRSSLDEYLARKSDRDRAKGKRR